MEAPSRATVDGVLVRFGEIGIKSTPVRRRMLDRLTTNLHDALLREGVEGGAQRRGARIWITGPDVARIADVARRVFGIVSVSQARLVPSDMDAMSEAAASLAAGGAWTSFAVRARRDGEHAFSSQDVGREVGSAVYRAAEAAGASPVVDLSDPDLEVHVDVRGPEAFVFTTVIPGPGGLPTGSQGTVAALVSDASSMLAAWLMMRRGCRVIPVHAGDMGSVPEGLEALTAWGLTSEVELLPVCSGTVAKDTLVRAAWKLGRGKRVEAVVTGDTLGSDLRRVADVPVLRPCCGLDLAEADRWARVAGIEQDGPAGAPLDDASTETVESLLSMHRKVSL